MDGPLTSSVDMPLTAKKAFRYMAQEGNFHTDEVVVNFVAPMDRSSFPRHLLPSHSRLPIRPSHLSLGCSTDAQQDRCFQRVHGRVD
jgi:hypothetical protein